MIYNKLCSLEDENCGSVLDFILRLIQELAVVPGSDVFLSFLHDKDDDNFVVQLLKSLDNPDCSLIKQKAALSILFTMFSKMYLFPTYTYHHHHHHYHHHHQLSFYVLLYM